MALPMRHDPLVVTPNGFWPASGQTVVLLIRGNLGPTAEEFSPIRSNARTKLFLRSNSRHRAIPARRARRYAALPK